MNPAMNELRGLRIAVEGCGHGTLNAIYASVEKAAEVRGWNSVDLVIIGGDFQAVRNASDLTVMSCPVKYREIGDFHAYYSGATKAPFLTIFVGGNHEASSHLWELFYGGWVAPNIYYMGAANVVRVGGVRIAGMSGIWKGYNYNSPHHERLPYNQDDIKSIYHVRELDIRKLLQVRTQVDIGISHDWPRAIEKHGNQRALFKAKPDFEQESKDGTLGNQAAAYVMDRLRPTYWLAAHMHCKFAASKIYEVDQDAKDVEQAHPRPVSRQSNENQEVIWTTSALIVPHNDDEIDLDMDGDEDSEPQGALLNGNGSEARVFGNLDGQRPNIGSTPALSTVPVDIRAQLPAAFQRPTDHSNRFQPGQPPPADITNKTVRFLALDKCLPGRKFLQILEIHPHKAPDSPIASASPSRTGEHRPTFEYDPEWLAITRVFALDLVLGEKGAGPKPDLGEEEYRRLIDKEQAWIKNNVVIEEKLKIPHNFEITAPPYVVGTSEIVNEGPREYNNPQMQTFCELIGIENKFFATDDERAERMREGPEPVEERRNGSFGRRGRGRGRGRGRSDGRGGDRGGRGFGRGWGRGW